MFLKYLEILIISLAPTAQIYQCPCHQIQKTFLLIEPGKTEMEVDLVVKTVHRSQVSASHRLSCHNSFITWRITLSDSRLGFAWERAAGVFDTCNLRLWAACLLLLVSPAGSSPCCWGFGQSLSGEGHPQSSRTLVALTTQNNFAHATPAQLPAADLASWGHGDNGMSQQKYLLRKLSSSAVSRLLSGTLTAVQPCWDGQHQSLPDARPVTCP